MVDLGESRQFPQYLIARTKDLQVMLDRSLERCPKEDSKHNPETRVIGFSRPGIAEEGAWLTDCKGKWTILNEDSALMKRSRKR